MTENLTFLLNKAREGGDFHSVTRQSLIKFEFVNDPKDVSMVGKEHFDMLLRGH